MVTAEEYLKAIQENFGLDFTKCESSNIFAYAFKDGKADKGTLYIAFKRGYIYEYKDVPKQIFANLETAESKGKYVNQYIVKGNYSFQKYLCS